MDLALTLQAIVMRECSFIRYVDETLDEVGKPQAQQQQQQVCLDRVSLEVERGELIGVIGHMGSGKSTLVEALAGEQVLLSGQLQVSERVMHVPNTPWLKGGTIRENILFGGACVQATYDRVVKACGLLVRERETEIGLQCHD